MCIITDICVDCRRGGCRRISSLARYNPAAGCICFGVSDVECLGFNRQGSPLVDAAVHVGRCHTCRFSIGQADTKSASADTQGIGIGKGFIVGSRFDLNRPHCFQGHPGTNISVYASSRRGIGIASFPAQYATARGVRICIGALIEGVSCGIIVV